MAVAVSTVRRKRRIIVKVWIIHRRCSLESIASILAQLALNSTIGRTPVRQFTSRVLSKLRPPPCGKRLARVTIVNVCRHKPPDIESAESSSRQSQIDSTALVKTLGQISVELRCHVFLHNTMTPQKEKTGKNNALTLVSIMPPNATRRQALKSAASPRESFARWALTSRTSLPLRFSCAILRGGRRIRTGIDAHAIEMGWS